MTIQEQLREHAEMVDAAYNQPGHSHPWAVELFAAADRLVALESALTRIENMTSSAGYRQRDYLRPGVIARDALEALDA